MIKLMDEIKKWKRVNTEVGKKMYRALNNRLRRSTDKAREIWYKSKCDEIYQNKKWHCIPSCKRNNRERERSEKNASNNG